VPFRTGSYTTDAGGTTPFTTIERQDVGLTLRIIPRVHEGDVVRLDVSQEVSSLAMR
jgi:general secretion pathway protein D